MIVLKILMAICIALLLCSGWKINHFLKVQEEAEKRLAEVEWELNHLLNCSIALIGCMFVIGIVLAIF